MSVPRLFYNLNGFQYFDFTEDVTNLQISYPRTLLGSIANSGAEERLNVRQDCVVTVDYDLVIGSDGGSDRSLKAELYTFFSMAERNDIPWSFARDAGEVVLTEAEAAAAGDTSVVVANPTGVTVGKRYVIRDEYNIETVEVESVTGTTVNLTDGLTFDYQTCPRFRSEEFWPGLFLTGEPSPIIELPPLHYGLHWIFKENMDCL